MISHNKCNSGLYGLKSDALDVAETVEDIPLNELLDGSYKSPLFTKDKEKKTLNSNESLLHVIRNACSLLQRPVQARSCSDDDDKITEPKHTGSSSAIETDGSKGDASASNVSSDDKVSFTTQLGHLYFYMRSSYRKECFFLVF